MELLVEDYGGGFPGSSVVKNPPASAGDTGSVPDLGRSHMLWKSRVPQLLSLWSRAWELQLLTPDAATIEAPGPKNPCSAKRETASTKSLSPLTRE